MVKKDVLRTYNRLQGNKLEKIIRCYRSTGVHAVVVFRFGKWLKKKGIFLRILLEPVYLFLFHRIRSKWGIEIPRTAEIGEGLYISHCFGVVISGVAKIGKNVDISQGVTIGVSGQGEKRGVPTIGDNVYIGAGAKIFGKIVVGNNVKIGANSIVHKDIPDNATVVLAPGFKIISYQGNRPAQESFLAWDDFTKRDNA
jgi:serine O-acetyltransferase